MAVLKNPVLLFLLAGLAAALLFEVFPGIDLWVSHRFWTPTQGWFWADREPFHFLYKGVPWLSRAIILGLVVLLGLEVLYGWVWSGLDRKRLIYLLATAIVGPGLLANTILKDHWGRARPVQISQFGGNAHFTPVLEPARECVTNCSFISGHGAMAFALVAFVFVIGDERKRRWAWLGVALFGIAVAITRIVQGGHFLSDNVFAALLMIAVAWMLHRWIVVADGLDRPGFRRGLRWLASGLAGIYVWVGRGGGNLWLAATSLGALIALLGYCWLDKDLALFLRHDDDRLIGVFLWLTQFGLGWGWLTLSGLAALILFGVSRSPRYAPIAARSQAGALVALFIFVSVAGAGLAADLVKILVGRPRPKLFFQDGEYGLGGLAWRADHWSFPSGHTTNVAALAMALTLIWPRHFAAYWLLTLLVAASRIGLNQHYLSDVIGGLWLGAAVTLYIERVFARSGVDLQGAARGPLPPHGVTSWRYRLLGR